jgi:hypothetical protein
LGLWEEAHASPGGGPHRAAVFFLLVELGLN